ncbi:MAG: hypothetical protein Q9188_005584 [Gyalolechia gomerana]
MAYSVSKAADGPGRLMFKGQNFTPERIQGAKDKALLKKEVSFDRNRQRIGVLTLEKTGLEDCADSFIAIAKNSSMTCQAVVVGKFIVPPGA